MSQARFFAEDLNIGTLALDEAEARHLAKSRRLSVGDAVIVFDGRGREGEATVQAVKRGVTLEIRSVSHRPRPVPGLTLAVALPKGPRQEVLLEKCTELGVRGIQPIVAARSVASASEHRLAKWRRTAVEAGKQSGQCWLPELHPPKRLEEFCGELAEYNYAVVATFGGVAPTFPPTAGSILAFVGPEGGWTTEEETLLKRSGAVFVSLGPNVLRIETAAIALAAMVHVLQR